MKYTVDKVKKAVEENYTISGVLKSLQIKVAGGNHRNIKRFIQKNNIDTSHFTGQAWSKGGTFERTNIQEYFNNNKFINSHALRLRLIEEGYKEYECEICKLKEWKGEAIPLELDHINSNHLDNSLNNLQIICPNCHAIETRKRIQNKKTLKVKIDKRTIRKVRPSKSDNMDIELLKKEVWKTPMSKLYIKYNLTGNGLKKICKKFNIEYPGLGYWAKLYGSMVEMQDTEALDPSS